MEEKILKLYFQGMRFDDIAAQVGCCIGTVRKYIKIMIKKTDEIQEQVEEIQLPVVATESEKPIKIRKPKKKRILTPMAKLINKIYKFRNGQDTSKSYIKDAIQKIGDQPKCYLTGLPIDLNQSNTYSLDHIIPSSRGGSVSLDNLGITTRQANMSKTDMTPEEYLSLCKLVLENNGYTVTKN